MTKWIHEFAPPRCWFPPSRRYPYHMNPLKPRAVRVRLLASLSVVGIITAVALSCQTFKAAPASEPKAVETPSDEAALAAAVLEGRELEPDCPSVVPLLRNYFRASEDFTEEALKRAMGFYLACPDGDAPEIFAQLVTQNRLATKARAWQLARTRPSPAMAKSIGLRLTSALGKADLDGLATAQVAEAVQANLVPESYTFLRKGFAVLQRPEFLRAMLVVDPEHARDDALSYLAKASFEELSSGEMKNVDPGVCKDVLAYLANYPPPLNHPNLGHLFLFAVASNKGLATRAVDVLSKMAAKQSPDLATAFSKMARDVQLAYAARLREVTQAGSDEALIMLRREIRSRVTDKEVVAELDR